MKKKTIILIAWPLSVLIGVWLGCNVGAQFGMKIGASDYHIQHIRRLSVDLIAASKTGDQRTREVLDEVSELVSTVGEPTYEKAREIFAAKIKDKQNKPLLPTGNSPTTSNPDHLSRPAAE